MPLTSSTSAEKSRSQTIFSVSQLTSMPCSLVAKSRKTLRTFSNGLRYAKPEKSRQASISSPTKTFRSILERAIELGEILLVRFQ
jgi:hypothetical protein